MTMTLTPEEFAAILVMAYLAGVLTAKSVYEGGDRA